MILLCLFPQQLRLKENELSSTRLLQKQAEHENQRLQSKQEEMSRQSEQRVRKERENAETEIESLKNVSIRQLICISKYRVSLFYF